MGYDESKQKNLFPCHTVPKNPQSPPAGSIQRLAKYIAWILITVKTFQKISVFLL
jgi:hypothetical protein